MSGSTSVGRITGW